jgi:hypothetical protein
MWARKQSRLSDISADSLALKQLHHRSRVLAEYQSPIFVLSPLTLIAAARFKNTRSQRSRTVAGASTPPAGFGKGADGSSQAPTMRWRGTRRLIRQAGP